MSISVIKTKTKFSLKDLQSKRKLCEKERDEKLELIRRGGVKDGGRILEEIKVLRDNLNVIKEAQARANSPILSNIYDLKELLDLRNNIYKGIEAKNLVLKSNIPELNQAINDHKKKIDGYNINTVVSIVLLKIG